tara:strand:+ start:1330 stop:2004 length:675 start_codon:yes stop_codon:yes gene_type:complete
MTKVFLEGRLGKIVGKSFSFSTRTLKETLAAVEANTGKLRSYFGCNGRRTFAIFINGKELTGKDFSLNINVKGKEILIIPMLFGAVAATLTTAIVGAMGLAGSKIATFVVGTLVSGALAFGLNMLITKLMAPDDPESLNTTSFLFGQAENVTKQGVVVPVGYGRMQIGSRVVSVNMFSVDRAVYDRSGAGLYDILKLKNESNKGDVITSDGVIQVSSLIAGGSS